MMRIILWTTCMNAFGMWAGNDAWRGDWVTAVINLALALVSARQISRSIDRFLGALSTALLTDMANLERRVRTEAYRDGYLAGITRKADR